MALQNDAFGSNDGAIQRFDTYFFGATSVASPPLMVNADEYDGFTWERYFPVVPPRPSHGQTSAVSPMDRGFRWI